MDRRNSPKAFTLIEVVVVVAILAVLTALLLGAVQKVRERSAALSVANSARQVVLAAHGYGSSRQGRLPNVDGNSPNPGLGALLALYPELGEGSVDAPVSAASPEVRSDLTSHLCHQPL